jgi:hypothetical protein
MFRVLGIYNFDGDINSLAVELYFFLEQHSFEKTKSIGLMAVSQMFLTMVAGNAPKTKRQLWWRDIVNYQFVRIPVFQFFSFSVILKRTLKKGDLSNPYPSSIYS